MNHCWMFRIAESSDSFDQRYVGVFEFLGQIPQRQSVFFLVVKKRSVIRIAKVQDLQAYQNLAVGYCLAKL